MISTSLKPINEVFLTPPTLVPSKMIFSSYKKALEIVPMVKYFFNTFIIVFGRIGGEVFVSALVAFGFARFEFKGKKFLFMVLLSLMMMPYEVVMIPTYIMWSKLGFVDSYLPLIIPSYFGSVTFIFFLRMYFNTFPRELEESAYMDGASNAKIFWSIFVPMSKPALITIGLWPFMGTWNDLLGQLIYINSTEKFTVQLGLASFSSITGGQVPYNALMAASLMALAPIVILFFFAQKYFVEGVKMSGIKG
jgi:multiple sugar transport system permease protein